MNEIITIIVVSIICIFLILMKDIEHVVFTTTYFKNNYKKKNIILNEKLQTLKKDGKSLYYKNQFNSDKSRDICKDKYKTSSLLTSKNIPVPKFTKWDKNKTYTENLKNINNNLKFPVVVKPTMGTQGYGVKTNITSNKEIKDHVEFLLKENKDILIEEHKKGLCYRALVFRGIIVGVVKRDYPYVIGDNKHTLKQLIDDHKNSDYKTHNIDETLLKQQNVSLNTVISKGKKITTSRVNNYHNGAVITDIKLENVHKDNLEIFLKINGILGTNLAGIDFITTDISKSYKENGGAIIEVNEVPDFKIHYEASKDKDKVVNIFVDEIFNT